MAADWLARLVVSQGTLHSSVVSAGCQKPWLIRPGELYRHPTGLSGASLGQQWGTLFVAWAAAAARRHSRPCSPPRLRTTSAAKDAPAPQQR